MKNKLKISSDSKIIQDMFFFLREHEFSREKYVNKISSFCSQKAAEINRLKDKKIIFKKLEETNFSDLSLYHRKGVSDKDVYLVAIFLSELKNAILDILDESRVVKRKAEAEKWKIERQIDPPLEAYEYKPFNKMDIGYSNKSYGLLFE